MPASMIAALLGVATASLAMLPAPVALVSIGLGAAMLAIARTDWRQWRIPDAISLPAIPVGLALSGRLLEPSSREWIAIDHVVGCLAGGAAFWAIREGYFRLRGREGLGLGDVKLAAVAGAWTGIAGIAPVTLLAAVTALLWVGALHWAARVAGQRDTDLTTASAIPFGVTLAPAIWLVWFAVQVGWLAF